MSIAPRRDYLSGLSYGFAHGGAAGSVWLKPNRKLNLLLEDTPRAVVHFFCSLFDSQRVRFQTGYWNDSGLREWACKAIRGAGAVVADHRHLEVIAHSLGFGASRDETGQRLVEHIGNKLCLACPRAHSIFH